ncbi:MAG: hypothetical protein ACYCX4_12985 [Bacillota bacterium]
MNTITKTVYFQDGYSLPNPLYSMGEFIRFNNDDLEELDDLRLYQEGSRIKNALAYCDLRKYFVSPDLKVICVSDWLAGRLAAIRREQRGRNG